MSELNEVLRSVGLTDSEVKVYSELMILKKATIVVLSKSLKMHRPNIYEALNRLVSKGLIFSSGKDYFANDYEKLFDYVEVKKSELDEKKSLISSLLPKIVSDEIKPSVVIYEGVNGLKSVFEEMLRTTDINYCVGAWDKPYIMEWFFKNWHNRRVKQGFTDKLIFSESGRTRGSDLKKLGFTEVKYLNKDSYSPAALNIFGNKVFLIIGSKISPIGIVIEDERVAKDFIGYFNFLWASAKD